MLSDVFLMKCSLFKQILEQTHTYIYVSLWIDTGKFLTEDFQISFRLSFRIFYEQQ